MNTHLLSRRGLLKVAAGVTAGGILAACQPKIVKETVVVEKEVEKVVKETVEVEKVVKETVQVQKVVKETVVVEKVLKEEVEIDFWYGTGLIAETQLGIFMEQHPNIKVNMSELGEAVFGDQKFMTAVAAGKGPSVALQNRHTFMQFAAKGMYLDITPYYEASGLKRADFTPVQLEETSWQGKIFGLPRETDTRLLYWNRKHFEEVGLDPDVPPKTWTELEQYADKLNKKDSAGNFDRIGFVPYLVGNTWMWLYGFLNGAPAISDDKRTILVDDPRWAEALQWLVDFYDKYIGSFELANSFSSGVSAAGLGDPFAAEKVSMVGHCDTVANNLLRNPELEWDVAPMPIPEGGVKSSWSCGWSLVMPPSAKYPDAAWELMRWWNASNEGWHANAEATVADTVRYWEREKISGTPLYMPVDACYLPAQKMLETEYVAKGTDVMKKAWAMQMDCLANWTHGCGTEMGLAALEYWVEIDNAVRTALAHQQTPTEAFAVCKKKVQEATDRAWESVESM